MGWIQFYHTNEDEESEGVEEEWRGRSVLFKRLPPPRCPPRSTKASEDHVYSAEPFVSLGGPDKRTGHH
ncbi:hypothetical protein E2C01_091441 [Portunus trituberculatus]|uniref:Uncharacterized protein n=1 Tax=Portunus trituberculatus TaxID=210409 RepID=A0A5B7JMY8_PORTR|nr:hypothetical protein [Portunus trituberculatus]